MTSESRACQNCKEEFVIEPEDFRFYEKIRVPPPTWCPQCRLMRRYSWRNGRVLYRRHCSSCKKPTIARFAPDVAFPVFCNPCWFSDRWNPLEYGRSFDHSKPFFEQFAELMLVLPQPALYQRNAANSEYCNHCLDVKDVYVSVSVLHSESVLYSERIDSSRGVVDSAYSHGLENCVECIDAVESSNVAHGQYIRGCLDSQFLHDVNNSSHCLGCARIRNGHHLILNVQYSVEEYERIKNELDLGSYANTRKFRKRFDGLAASLPKKYAAIDKSVNTTGDRLQNCKECEMCFDAYNCENCKYLNSMADGSADCYDQTNSGKTELCYETASCVGRQNKFVVSWGNDIQYSFACLSLSHSNLFGCVSMPQTKEYCVLNKQYSKEEYEKIVPKIIQHMNDMPYVDQQGRVYKYGEFFPPELSPFAYNETIAQEYFPLTKEEALKQGYRWRDPDTRSYTITMTHDRLPDHIKDVTDDILKETIGCLHNGTCTHQCTTAFRVIPEELQFYRRMNLPLPRLCPNCRHYERLAQRNPLKLWHRTCTCGGAKSDNGVYANAASHRHGHRHCAEEFETSYAPERKEIVYCESCYNSEVV